MHKVNIEHTGWNVHRFIWTCKFVAPSVLFSNCITICLIVQRHDVCKHSSFGEIRSYWFQEFYIFQGYTVANGAIPSACLFVDLHFLILETYCSEHLHILLFLAILFFILLFSRTYEKNGSNGILLSRGGGNTYLSSPDLLHTHCKTGFSND